MWIYKIFWAGKVQIFDSYFVKKNAFEGNAVKSKEKYQQ